MAEPLWIAGGVRIGLVVMASLAVRLMQGGAGPNALDMWNRWDSIWYLSIVQQGYTYSPTAQSSVVFYPLLPLLIWLLGQPLTLLFDAAQAYLVAGLVISWAAFLGAGCLFYRLVCDRYGAATARSALVLLAVYPFSFFFGTVYTESLFLLLAMIAFLAIERKRWWLAALAAGLASATRSPGLFLGVCVVLAYALDWWRTRRLTWGALWLALTPLGTAAYLFYCYLVFGDPSAPMKSSDAGWRRGRLRLDGAAQGISLLLHPETWLFGTQFKPLLFGLYSVLTVLFLLSVILIWRWLGPVYAVFALLSILVPIFVDDVMVSEGRYLSMVFPTFIVLAHGLRERPALRDALIAALAVCLGLFTVLFALNYEIY